VVCGKMHFLLYMVLSRLELRDYDETNTAELDGTLGNKDAASRWLIVGAASRQMYPGETEHAS
jgi:hypothetical protein